MIGNFFHTPKNKSFNIPFRFYNPEKEEMEAREKRIKGELGIEDESNSAKGYNPQRMRGTFRHALEGPSKSALEQRRRSNRRLIIFILILAAAFYLILYR